MAPRIPCSPQHPKTVKQALAFLDRLSAFSDSTITASEMLKAAVDVIVAGPTLVAYGGNEPDLLVPVELDMAMALDFVLDEGPGQDHEEARRLARSYVALLHSMRRNDPLLPHLVEFARYADTTIERLSAHLDGTIDRGAMEQFIQRRSWPHELSEAVLALDEPGLRGLVANLSRNEWVDVRHILGGNHDLGPA